MNKFGRYFFSFGKIAMTRVTKCSQAIKQKLQFFSARVKTWTIKNASKILIHRNFVAFPSKKCKNVRID